MNVSGVSSAASPYYTQQTQSTGAGLSFSQMMEKMRSTQTAAPSQTAEAAARAASVRAGLDSETLAFLERYTALYNQYAAQYGDGFEIVRTQYCDGSAGDAEESARTEARGVFIDALYEAGIPGYGRRLTVEDLQGGQFNFEQISFESLKTQYNNEISALFYAEKYGLAGLTKDEQCKAVLGGLKTSTAEEMFAAAQKLYNIGAISAYEAQAIQRYTSMAASQSVGLDASREELIAAQKDAKLDWSGLLETLKDSEDGKEIYELLSKAWDTEEDEEDQKLKAVLRKIDAQQKAIHEAIEQSIQKRREQELLDRASAESARLRIMFGLDHELSVDTADMVQETAEAVMSIL